jgi:hypothetical protein
MNKYIAINGAYAPMNLAQPAHQAVSGGVKRQRGQPVQQSTGGIFHMRFIM